MSTSIDNKVVEMQFDNKEFEKNVQTSLRTIDDLNKKLQMQEGVQGLRNVQYASESIDMAGLSDAIDKVRYRFSTLGIMATTILQNITTAAMGAAKKVATVVTDSVVKGGYTRASNIEQAKFMIEGLKADWKQLYPILDDAVTGTAYSLDSAAKVASQLVASSVKIGKPMSTALKSISGIAAMTNSSYDEIGEIYTTIAGNGKLMTEQLRQFSFRGLNAAATLSEYFNKINDGSTKASDHVKELVKNVTGGNKMTEASIRELVTKGKIDFELFASTMNLAFGKHAYKANETLTGVLSNTKAALARIGADFFTPIIKNKGPLVDFMEQVRQRINEFHKAAQPSIDVFSNTVVRFIQRMTDMVKGTATNVPTVGKIFNNTFIGMRNIVDGFGTVLQLAGNALGKTFGGSALNALLKVSEAFRSMTEHVRMSAKNMSNISSIFGGFFAVLHIGYSFITALLKPFGELITQIFPALGNGALSGAASIGELLIRLDQFLEKANVFGKISETISKGLSHVVENFKALRNSEKSFGDVTFEAFATIGKGIGVVFKAIGNGIKKVMGPFSKVVESFANMIARMIDTITNMFANFNGKDLLAGGIFAAIILAVRKSYNWIDTLKTQLGLLDVKIGKTFQEFKKFFQYLNGTSDGKSLYDTVSNLGDINSIFANLRKSLYMFKTKIKFENLRMMATSILELAIAMTILASIPADDLGRSLAAIGALSGILLIFLGVIENTSRIIKPSERFATAAPHLVAMSVSLLILAGAMKKLAGLSWSGLAKGLIGVTALLAELTIISAVATKNEMHFMKGAAAVIALGIGLRILTASVVKMGSLNLQQLLYGLAGVSVLLLEITAVSQALSNMKFAGAKMMTVGAGLVLFSTAMILLTSAVKHLGGIDAKTLMQGLIGVSIILGEITAITAAISNFTTAGVGSKMIAAGVGLIAISMAIAALSESVKTLGGLKIDELKNGVIAISALLGVITALSIAIGKLQGGGMIAAGAGFVLMAASINIIQDALISFSKLSMEEIGRGLIAIGGALAEFAIAARLMSGAVAGAAGILIVAAALSALTPILLGMAQLNFKQVGAMLLGIGGAIGVFAVAAALVTPILPAMLGLAAALALIGAASALFGAGIAHIGGGLLACAAALEAFIKVVESAKGNLKENLAEIIESLPEMIKIASTFSSFAMRTFLQSAKEILPMFGDVLKELFNLFVVTIGDNVITLGQVGMKIITAMMDGINNNIFQISTTAASIVANFIRAMAVNHATLVEAGIDFITTYLNGMAEGIRTGSEEISAAVLNLISALAEMVLTGIQTILTLIPGIGPQLAAHLETAKTAVRQQLSPEEMQNIGVNATQGLADGIKSKTPEVSNAFNHVANETESKGSSAFSGVGTKLIGTFMSAFMNNSSANLAGGEMSSSVLNGIDASASDFEASGTGSAESYISGFMSTGTEGTDGLSNSIIESLNASSGQFAKAGKSNSQSYASAIDASKPTVKASASSLASSASKTAQSTGGSGMTQAGSYAGQGFNNGLNSWKPKVQASANSMAKGCLDAAKKALGIHSPSKEFELVGKYGALGLARGFDVNADTVNSSIDDMTNNIIATAAQAMSIIESILSEDTQPTITPVVDMSNVLNSANSIGGLFGSAGINANVTSASALMTARNQNGNANDVVSAINKLGSMLDSKPSNVYNVNGLTYSDDINVTNAVNDLVNAIVVQGRA